MCKIFKENRLDITVECNLAVTDSFDLKCGTGYTYRKQQREIIYKQSNLYP